MDHNEGWGRRTEPRKKACVVLRCRRAVQAHREPRLEIGITNDLLVEHELVLLIEERRSEREKDVGDKHEVDKVVDDHGRHVSVVPVPLVPVKATLIVFLKADDEDDEERVV